MELLKKDKQWFFSDEGKKAFASLSSVGDRAVFIYSYLKTIANENSDKDNILFKTAFLLADEVFASDLPYKNYPDIINERVNPFIAFLSNAKRVYASEQIYCIYLSIVHNIANPIMKNDWIYDEAVFKGDGYIRKIDELGHMFVVPNPDFMVDAGAYKCDEKIHMIQLEIIWLFGKK